MSEPDRSRPLPLRVVDRLTDLAGYTSAIAILAAVLIICYGVLLRYFVGASTVWQTELSVYLLIYATFVGAAYGLKHGDHVAVELVVARFSAVPRDVLKLVVAALCIALAVVVGVLAVELWWEVVTEGRRSGTAWNPPLAFPYAILPVGMLLVAVQYVVIAADTWRRLRAGGGRERGDGQDGDRPSAGVDPS